VYSKAGSLNKVASNFGCGQWIGNDVEWSGRGLAYNNISSTHTQRKPQNSSDVRSIFENARHVGSFEEPKVFLLVTKFLRYLNFRYIFQGTLPENFNTISYTPDSPCFYSKLPNSNLQADGMWRPKHISKMARISSLLQSALHLLQQFVFRVKCRSMD
jgi:hypothetical protein